MRCVIICQLLQSRSCPLTSIVLAGHHHLCHLPVPSCSRLPSAFQVPLTPQNSHNFLPAPPPPFPLPTALPFIAPHSNPSPSESLSPAPAALLDPKRVRPPPTFPLTFQQFFLQGTSQQAIFISQQPASSICNNSPMTLLCTRLQPISELFSFVYRVLVLKSVCQAWSWNDAASGYKQQ